MSAELFKELIGANPAAVIELFELQLVQSVHKSSEIYRFHNGVNGTLTAGDVYWNGQSYSAFPIEVEGFEYSGNGQLPRPKVRVANIFGSISAILVDVNNYAVGNDLTGAKFTRIRTLSRFLDAVNFTGNVNPYGTPDPDAEMPKEIYYVDRKTTENRNFVEFELAAAFDLVGVRTPKRIALATACSWKYRGSECGYTGTNYFDENDNALATTPATNFPAGTATLAVNNNFFVDQYLTSSNRWYRTLLQQDGNLVTYAKDSTPRWALSTLNSGAYRLTVQSDGNLVIYRNDGSAVWASGTDLLGVPTAVRHMDWRQETIVNTGRAGAFFYEVLGNADTYAGQTRTATKLFTFNNNTITLSYTATSTQLSQTYKDAFTALGRTVNYSWTQGTPSIDNDYGDPNLKPMAKATVSASTGMWRANEYFNAQVTVSANNPWRNGDPVASPGTQGTFQTVAGVYYVRTASGYATNYLTQQNDGNLVLYHGGTNTALWASGYATPVEPVVVIGTVNAANDVCGKRLSSCRKRFGQNAELPFGGFPGVGGFYG
jgi:hypothetical protein